MIFGTRAERQVKEEFAVDESKLNEAIDFYRQATLADPNSLAAHARLAAVLLYSGDVDGAAAPLTKAIDLGARIEPGSATADLSHAWSTTALYLLATRSETGIELAYKQAIALNPNNVEALGAYAQWLMVHNRARPRSIFAKRFSATAGHCHDTWPMRSIWQSIEDMEAVREVATSDREPLHGRTRLSRTGARFTRTLGSSMSASRGGSKLFREQPRDDETRGQVGELYARIGEFETAAAYDSGPHMYQLYYARRYDELVDLAQETVLQCPDDLSAQYMLGFAYNVVGDFDAAKHILSRAGLPIMPGAEYVSGGAEMTALMSYIDALQGLDADDAEARMYAEARARVSLGPSRSRNQFVVVERPWSVRSRAARSK